MCVLIFAKILAIRFAFSFTGLSGPEAYCVLMPITLSWCLTQAIITIISPSPLLSLDVVAFSIKFITGNTLHRRPYSIGNAHIIKSR